MKKSFKWVVFALLIFVIACEKESSLSFGFDTAIEISSDGTVIAPISEDEDLLFLKGQISLTEGEVEINLLNPNGVSVYSKTLIAPIELNMDETFEPLPGNWELSYQSNGGIGSIKLHLQN